MKPKINSETIEKLIGDLKKEVELHDDCLLVKCKDAEDII